MNTHVGVTFGPIVLLGGIVLLVLFLFDFMSVSLMGMSRQHRSEDPVRTPRRTHFFRIGLLPAILVAVVILVVVRIKDYRNNQEPATVATVADESLREAMHDLSEARRDMQEAISDVARVIPVMPPIASLPQANAVTVGISGPFEATSASGPVPAAIASSATSLAADEETQKRKLELTAHIGHWIREFLRESPEQVATDAALAAESANGDVVVLQLSDQMTKQLIGESGRALLKSFNSDLPEHIRRTYAVIPLGSPVDAVAPIKPFLANGALEAIANLIVSMAERGDPATPNTTPAATGVAVALAGTTADQPMPEWLRKPGAGRIVVESKSVLAGENAEEPLMEAVNEALADHLSVFTETLDPVLSNQTRFVRLELDHETAERCVIVDRFERLEEIESGVEGPTPFRKVYALLEFPESVDKIALQKIQQSLQSDRIGGLGMIVMCAWLSVCSAGCAIRLWRSGPRWLRLTAIPVTGIVALTLMVCATGLTIALSSGETIRPPWADNAPPVMIHIDSQG